MRNYNNVSGFTLIELLVVITIIVVLLALLTPALDRAIYQAELTVCAAQVDSVGAGVTTYTMSFNRRYPLRRELSGEQGATLNWKPHQLRDFYETEPVDDRAALEGYVSLDSLVDPFCDEVDLSDSANDVQTSLWASYTLWWGWGYSGRARMSKLGDGFSWSGTHPVTGQQIKYRFPYLISDHDNVENFDGDVVWNTHPDEDGVMSARVAERADRRYRRRGGRSGHGPLRDRVRLVVQGEFTTRRGRI